jgi:hypothetical protein
MILKVRNFPKFIRRYIASMFFLIMPTTLIAAECSAKSGLEIVPLLELYTSEGCSSCPPADKWLGDIKLSAKKVVPLAFHVDYWDYIGWKDQFAKSEYSDRQHKMFTHHSLLLMVEILEVWRVRA